MDGLELICFQIISFSGSARSIFVEAMKAAKSGDFKEARRLITEGEKIYYEGHKVHSDLLQEVANGNYTDVTLLLTHAEDQLMSAEIIRIMAEELLSLYGELKDLKFNIIDEKKQIII
jgi:PTS system cellobiose-specific IIA component